MTSSTASEYTYDPNSGEHLWVWRAIEDASARGNYVELLAYNTILDYYLQPNRVSDEQRELLRLLGVKPPDFNSPSETPRSNETLRMQRFDTSQNSYRLLRANYQESSSQISVINSTNPTWAAVPAIDVPETHLRKFSDAQLTVGQSYFIEGESLIIDSSQYLNGNVYSGPTSPSDKPQKSEPDAEVAGGVHLAYPLGVEFGHLWNDLLARVCLLNDLDLPENSTLILDDGHPPVNRELIERLKPRGIETAYFPSGTVVDAQELFTIDSPVYRPNRIPDFTQLDKKRIASLLSTYQCIRAKMPPIRQDKTPSTRLLIERVNARQRKSPSLDALLLSSATNAGFSPVDPARFDLESQVSLFASAERIIGAWGSWFYGLLAFGASGSQVLVITNDRPYEIRHALRVGQQLGFKISVVEASRMLKLPYYSERNYHGEVQLDPESLGAISSWLHQ